MSARDDLTGRRFGLQRVIRSAGSNAAGDAIWWVACDCGSPERIVRGSNLRAGRSKSCGGCLRPGADGRWATPEFQALHDAKRRCYDPKNKDYHLYGARGVEVCERWRNNFPAFLEDMGYRPTSKHTLDRWPNRDGDYTPQNCRWATQREQQRNRRNNRRAEFRGAMLCASELAELSPIGVPVSRIYERLKSGWSAEHAISTPIGKPRPAAQSPRVRIRLMSKLHSAEL